MTDFLHTTAFANAGQTVEVTLDQQANVMLLDPTNFSCYRSGMSFHYHGGLATYSPFRIRVPYTGHWNLVIDLGGGRGTIRYSVRMLN